MLDHVGFAVVGRRALEALLRAGAGAARDYADHVGHARADRGGRHRARLRIRTASPISGSATTSGSAREHTWRSTVDTRAKVEAFYQAALAAGGKDNGAPGIRPHYHPNYYAAFVYDPDGSEHRSRLPSARMSQLRIFTIGYEGATVGDFIAALTSAGVERVIDVRAVPQSRRPGFSKTPLRNALAEAGIDYRPPARAGDAGRWARARRERGGTRSWSGSTPASSSCPKRSPKERRCSSWRAEKPSALLCYERDPGALPPDAAAPRDRSATPKSIAPVRLDGGQRLRADGR